MAWLTRSMIPPGRVAERTPSGTVHNRPSIIAATDSENVAGKRCPISCATGWNV